MLLFNQANLALATLLPDQWPGYSCKLSHLTAVLPPHCCSVPAPQAAPWLSPRALHPNHNHHHHHHYHHHLSTLAQPQATPSKDLPSSTKYSATTKAGAGHPWHASHQVHAPSQARHSGGPKCGPRTE
jgi:hypothetical protein